MNRSRRDVRFPSLVLAFVAIVACSSISRAQPSAVGARQQPGTNIGIYSPELHQLYSGRFRITGTRVYAVGGLFDKPGWDHIDNEAKHVRAVPGSVEIDVDEKSNRGQLTARLKLPEGDFLLVMNRFVEFQPCQDGGIAAWLFEHGDSGCGDSNWPKSLVYVGGWGYANGSLNGKVIYRDYQAHFMVTQGMRDRETLKVHYPVLSRRTHAGQVDPAAVQIDFYIRSNEPDLSGRNDPPRKVFAHFFCTEVTWR